MAVLQTALVDVVGLLHSLVGIAEGDLTVLDHVAEIAEEFRCCLALHGQTEPQQFTLTDSQEFLRTAVVQLEHLDKTATAAFLLMEIVFYLVLLTLEDDYRIGVPVG